MRPDVGGRRKARGRRLFEGRRVAGVTSVIAPLAVGVVLAFAWNTAGSYKPGSPTPNPGFSPEVEVAAEQAAAQTWASTAGCAAPRKPRRAGEGESPASAGPARPASRRAAQQLRDLRAQAQPSRA